jgi:hypothetical protein
VCEITVSVYDYSTTNNTLTSVSVAKLQVPEISAYLLVGLLYKERKWDCEVGIGRKVPYMGLEIYIWGEVNLQEGSSGKN